MLERLHNWIRVQGAFRAVMTFNPSAASLLYLEQEVSGRSRAKGHGAGWSCVGCSQSLWLWHIKCERVEKVN